MSGNLPVARDRTVRKKRKKENKIRKPWLKVIMEANMNL